LDPHVKNNHHEDTNKCLKNIPNKTFSSSSSRSKTDRQKFKDGGDDSTTPIGNCGDIFLDEIEAQAFFLA
jgi:hypothetical protein